MTHQTHQTHPTYQTNAGTFPRNALFAVLIFAAGCAARSGSPSAAADLATADRLQSVGCYRCLVDALAIYERTLEKTRRPSPALQWAAFETATLLLLRQKELGVPSAATLDKARKLAAIVRPVPGRLAPATLVTLADLAPSDTASADPDESAARNSRERRTELTTLRPQLSETATPSLLERYLALTFDCNDAVARRAIKGDELLASVNDVPILRYRVAACGFGPRETFASIRQDDSRWTEAAFFEGRAAASGRRPDLRGGIALFMVTRDAIPESAGNLLALAHAQRGYGDLEPAVASYDAVIGLVPRNREALLGRAITLSYLERHQEVVETTTKMIDYGRWLLGDAYYWRARSRYVLKEIEEAWSDAENAVQLSPTTNVYTLAGVIAYDRKDLDTARERFERARQMDLSNCTAHFYFALVNVGQNQWAAATPVFSQAMTCFVQAAAEARQELNQIEASDFDEVYKGRLAAQQTKTIEESELKAAQSAYNAAQGLLREGKRGDAATHLKLALEHPDVRTQAETLQKLIGQ
jgi:tetratricopeptide (TPR) repeat protein